MRPGIFTAPALFALLIAPLPAQAQPPIYLACSTTVEVSRNVPVGTRDVEYFRVSGETLSRFTDGRFQPICEATSLNCTFTPSRDAFTEVRIYGRVHVRNSIDRISGRIVQIVQEIPIGLVFRSAGECTPGENPETSARRF